MARQKKKVKHENRRQDYYTNRGIECIKVGKDYFCSTCKTKLDNSHRLAYNYIDGHIVFYYKCVGCDEVLKITKTVNEI